MAFTSPVDIAGKGNWYRVYIGSYKSLAEANTASMDLKRRKFCYVNVTRKPYTVQIGRPIAQSEARKFESRLQARGYFSYSLPAATDPSRIRVLVGAFENEQAAASLSKQLKREGFYPKIVLR